MNEKPVAIVSGASRGIGAATAMTFGERGYDVALTARSEGALQQVAGRIENMGRQALVCPGDLGDIDFAQSVIEQAAAKWGRIDVLVNNAAWREVQTMRQATVESWEKTLRICLTAPAFMAKAAAVHMEKRQSGVIINISSIQSTRPPGIGPAYVACKGALDSLTYELATLYGPHGIRVVAINPGAIDTDMGADYTTDEGENISAELRTVLNDMIPQRRWATSEEIARTIVWAAGPDASYVTGTTIVADGGLLHQLTPYSIKKRQFPEQFP
jgi:NAD(P)-dependent dehydrogenase (short-subunit alcohol dehydrogenase family)